MVKYVLISPFGETHVTLFNKAIEGQKSLTHSSNDVLNVTAQDIEDKWQFFKNKGWTVKKVRVTINF